MRPRARSLPIVCTLLTLLSACSRPSEPGDSTEDRIESADRVVVIEKASPAFLRALGVNVQFEARGRTGLRRRYGGSGTAYAVEEQLNWLARHQTPEEGDWDAIEHREQCCGNICSHPGSASANPALTGLALLDFLAGGYTHQAGKYKTNVGWGILYLKRIQDEEGCFGPRQGPFLFGHACCTLAMAEAYGLTSLQRLQRPLEKAVAFLMKAQNGDPGEAGKLAWGERPRSGRNHLAVTTWAMMALRSAKDAGIEVAQTSLDGVKTWLERVTDPETGVVRLDAELPGGGLPCSSPEARTAMGILIRVILGEDPARSPIIEKGRDFLLGRLGNLRDEHGFRDATAWYFGTLALFKVGGRPWHKWNRALKSAVIKPSAKSGCEKGSWTPRGTWAAFGGRTYATALLAMATKVYYRYGKVVGTRYSGGAFSPEPDDTCAAPPGVGALRVIGAGPDRPAQFPLEHTDVKAEVSGWLATTRVTQTFVNPNQRAVEAVYVFPLPTTAAVNDFVMEIQGRRIVGVVRPREGARRVYREALKRGQTASLLTQERPNVFTQSVANIEPGGKVQVRVTYFHPLEYDQGRYEYVLPMVVGPRYVPGTPVAKKATPAGSIVGGGGTAPDTEQVPDASRISPPIMPPGTRSGHDIAVEVALHAGMPIEDLRSPTHAIRILATGPGTATVALAAHETIPNRDFVLRWRVAGSATRVGFVAHRSNERGGFFSAFLIPLLDPSDADVTPREVTFVLDTSGSMHGLPLDLVKRMVRRSIQGLRPGDRFNIIQFSGSSGMLSPTPLENTVENREYGLYYLDTLRGGGGTEMLAGIRAYLARPRDRRYVRVVCFLTDGFVANEEAIHATILEHGQDARWFCFGIGSSVNRHLVEGIALHGRGASAIVLARDPQAAEKAANRFLMRLDSPLLVDVTLDVNGLPITDVHPKKIPDLFAGRPLHVTGRYAAPAEGTLVFRGRIGAKRVALPFRVALPRFAPGHAALGAVWARSRIRDLTHGMLGQSRTACEGLKKEIIATAVEHRLVSRYTSFVAVDETRVTGDGRPIRVLQPVGLPEGVSREGVAGASSAGARFRVAVWGLTLAEDAKAQLVVNNVDPDGPAARAGIRSGMRLETVGRHALFGARHLEALLWQLGGESVIVGLRANGAASGDLRAARLPRP